MAHTPGPWSVGELSGDFGKDRIVSASIQTIAAVYATEDHFDVKVEEPTRDANAALIAAAPDLLAALKDTRDALALLMRAVAVEDVSGVIVDEWITALGSVGIENGVGVRADAAIAKAEGR